MQIYGISQVHAAQPISSPHRAAAAAPAAESYGNYQTDEVNISQEAELLAQVRDIPEIRADRVAEIRAQIADGTYDSDEKLDIALSRLLDEIG